MFHVNKRTAALGDSLLAKAVLCRVSIVRPTLISLRTNRVRKEMGILWLPTALFDESICFLSIGLYVWKKLTILPRLKSSIPAVKSLLESSSKTHTEIEVHEAFYGNITKYFVHAQTISTRSLLGGRGLGTRLLHNMLN